MKKQSDRSEKVPSSQTSYKSTASTNKSVSTVTPTIDNTSPSPIHNWAEGLDIDEIGTYDWKKYSQGKHIHTPQLQKISHRYQ